MGSDADDSVTVWVDPALAAELMADKSTPTLRPLPGLRGAEVAAIAEGLLVAIGTSADLVGLALAREHIVAFIGGLLRSSRRKLSRELRLTYRSDGVSIQLLVSSESSETDLKRLLLELSELVR